MNLKDEHTSRLWNFIMKGEIMAFDLDESELIATRINNRAASWKEVEEYIEKYYVKKDKVKEKYKKCEYYEMVADELYKNSISKDKIRNKIKELEDNMILFTNDKEKFNRYKYARDVLEKILGE